MSKILQRVINFSGGKTSAFMTIHEYREGDIVLFCDTGREHQKTYKFIHDFEAHEQIPVTWINYDGYFDGFLAKNNYRRIPNRMKRICTVELKVNTAKRYLKSIGIIRFENLIGFRADEPKRVEGRIEHFKKVVTRFPLYEQGIDKQMINEYWKNKPYTLEITSILGNCTLCFMKGVNAISSILTIYPELAEPWINDEKQSEKQFGHTYFPGVTIEQIRDRAQNNLFKDLPEYVEFQLSQMQPSLTCACTT